MRRAMATEGLGQKVLEHIDADALQLEVSQLLNILLAQDEQSQECRAIIDSAMALWVQLIREGMQISRDFLLSGLLNSKEFHVRQSFVEKFSIVASRSQSAKAQILAILIEELVAMDSTIDLRTLSKSAY